VGDSNIDSNLKNKIEKEVIQVFSEKNLKLPYINNNSNKNLVSNPNSYIVNNNVQNDIVQNVQNVQNVDKKEKEVSKDQYEIINEYSPNKKPTDLFNKIIQYKILLENEEHVKKL